MCGAGSKKYAYAEVEEEKASEDIVQNWPYYMSVTPYCRNGTKRRRRNEGLLHGIIPDTKIHKTHAKRRLGVDGAECR